MPLPSPVPEGRARELLVAHALVLPTKMISLESALGCVLAKPVRADRDLPPFDRSAVDGYAVRLADPWNESGSSFVVRGTVAAGQRWTRLLRPGDAVQIMTGAPVPRGADGVVMVENSSRDGDTVTLVGPFSAQNRSGLAQRGEDARRGESVVLAGTRIGPQQVAVLASVGAIKVRVFARPTVDLITTGDEVVEPREKPGPAQIRNSNGPFLQSLLLGSGWVERVTIRRARDESRALRTALSRSQSDVLVLTGGVSMGEFDLVPDALRDLGYQVHLHRIAIRPGKPILFGTKGKGAGRRAVFGLPGNPVSVAVTAWEFLLPYLRSAAGALDPQPMSMRATAAESLHRKPGLTHFVPARITAIPSSGEGGPAAGDADALPGLRAAAALPSVKPVAFHGSGDFVALGRCDGWIRLEAEHPAAEVGDIVEVHPFFRERTQIPEAP